MQMARCSQEGSAQAGGPAATLTQVTEAEVPWHAASPQGSSGHGLRLPQRKGSKREVGRVGRESERQTERQRDRGLEEEEQRE